MSFFRKLLSLALLFLGSATLHARAQEVLMSLDSPIKVGGGAMTFYTRYDWHPYGNQRGQYCAVAGNTAQIVLSGFNRQLLKLNAGQQWTMQMFTTRGRKIILQDIGKGSCNGQNGEILVVTLPPELVPYASRLNKRGIRNHFRIREQSCSPTDPDLCERLDKVVINGKPFECDDLDCSLYIGQ